VIFPDPGTLALVATVAFVASILGGVTGYGTGLLLPPVLVPIIGAEAVVPVIAVASLLTNTSRVWAFWSALDIHLFRRITVVAFPTTILGAYGYSLLSGHWAMLLIGTVLLILVPLRHIARRKSLYLQDRGILGASIAYGAVVGGTAGSGVALLSILMAAGLSGMAVIATDAAISIVLGTIKSTTFVAAGALDTRLFIWAILIGLAAMPGAFLAKRFAHMLKGSAHILILDASVVAGAIFLITSAIRG